jgi:hypothetical protein
MSKRNQVDKNTDAEADRVFRGESAFAKASTFAKATVDKSADKIRYRPFDKLRASRIYKGRF